MLLLPPTISATRAQVGWIGVESDTAAVSFDGAVLSVLETTYFFTAQWYFRAGFLLPRHVVWPTDDIVYDCAAQFYPSGLPGVCSWSWAWGLVVPGTALGFVIRYGLPGQNVQRIDIAQVPSSRPSDPVPPDPT